MEDPNYIHMPTSDNTQGGEFLHRFYVIYAWKVPTKRKGKSLS